LQVQSSFILISASYLPQWPDNDIPVTTFMSSESYQTVDASRLFAIGSNALSGSMSLFRADLADFD